jgi:hypothetical protein
MQDMQAEFIVHVTAPVVLLIAGRVAASFISTALLQFDKNSKSGDRVGDAPGSGTHTCPISGTPPDAP